MTNVFDQLTDRERRRKQLPVPQLEYNTLSADQSRILPTQTKHAIFPVMGKSGNDLPVRPHEDGADETSFWNGGEIVRPVSRVKTDENFSSPDLFPAPQMPRRSSKIIDGDGHSAGGFYPKLDSSRVEDQTRPPVQDQTRPLVGGQEPDLRDEWLKAERSLSTAQNKDYGIRRGESGEIIRGKDRKEKWSFWDKVGNTLLGVLLGFGQGGIGGAVMGGVKGGTDRNYRAKLRDQLYEIPQAQKRADAARQAYETNLAFLGKEADETRKASDDWRKEQAFLQKTHENFLQSLLADGVFDEDDSKAYEQMTGQKIAPFDNRQYETERIEGETYQRPKTGGGAFGKTNLPPVRVEQPIGAKIPQPDGTTMIVPMLPEKGANFQYKAQQDKAREEGRQDRYEQGKQDKADVMNFKTVQEWRKARVKARGEIAGHQKVIQQLNASIAEVDQQINQYKGNYDVSDLLKTKQKLEQQRSAFQAKLAEADAILRSPRPEGFKPSRQNPRRRNYSSSDIDSIIRQ